MSYRLITKNCKVKMAAIKLLSHYVRAEVYAGVPTKMVPAKRAYEKGVLEIRISKTDFLELKKQLRSINIVITEDEEDDNKEPST